MPKWIKNPTGLFIGAVVFAILIIAGLGVYHMRAAADSSASSGSLTLDPGLFQGDTHQAYLVAQQHPDLLAQLHCYCGCEQHEGHRNLLECFRTNHGAGCATCIGEAVMAGQLFDNGTPPDQIRAQLEHRFAHGG